MMNSHAWALFQRLYRALNVVEMAGQTLCERTEKFLCNLEKNAEGFMDGRPDIENAANTLWDLADALNTRNEELNVRWQGLEDVKKIL